LLIVFLVIGMISIKKPSAEEILRLAKVNTGYYLQTHNIFYK
jgi:hypothetical protein